MMDLLSLLDKKDKLIEDDNDDHLRSRFRDVLLFSMDSIMKEN